MTKTRFFPYVLGTLFFLLSLFSNPLFAQENGKPYRVKKEINNIWQLQKSSFERMQAQITLGEISSVYTSAVESYGNFLSLEINGYVQGGKVGEPSLPRQIRIIELPQGAVPRVKIRKDRSVTVQVSDLSGTAAAYPIFPVQPPLKKNAEKLPPFQYNQAVYQQNDFGSQALVSVEIMGESRGVRLAKLIICPVEYNPNKGLLRIHTQLEFEVVFDQADADATQRKKLIYHSSAFEKTNRLGINSANLQSLAKAEEDQDRPLCYAIVSDAKFKDSLQGFIDWKNQQGFKVVEAYTSDPKVGKTNVSIQAYLKSLYDGASTADPAPSYVLLVGDVAEIPPFKSRCEQDLNDHITDLYFAEYTGDFLPDAFLGRFSATKVSELMPQIHKTMQMAQIKPEEAAFMDTTLLIAGNDRRFGSSHLNPQLRYIQRMYANMDSCDVFSLLYPYPASSSEEMRDDMLQRLSAGVGFVCYTGHGNISEWSDPLVDNDIINTSFKNKDRYPFAIGNCCLSGKFDANAACFGEGLLRASDKGAVAYVGATNSSYFGEDFYWSVGYTDISSTPKEYTYEETGIGTFDGLYHTHGEEFSTWSRTGSEIIYNGNMAVVESGSELTKYYWEIYELFGDPSYMPYKNKPAKVKLECDEVVKLGSATMEVQTDPYAQVALSRDNTVFSVALADSEGNASLATSGIEVGNYTLYGRSQFKSENQKNITTVAPTGRYVYIEKIKYIDPSGKEVTDFEYAGTYKISLDIVNLGTEDVEEIKFQMKSSDPGLVLGEDYIYKTLLPKDARASLKDIITIKVDPNIKDRHLFEFAIEETYGSGVNDKNIKPQQIRARAPQFEWVSFEIGDKTSDHPFDVLEPGQSAPFKIKWKNVGSAKAYDLKAKISADMTYITPPTALLEWGEIGIGDTLSKSFDVSAAQGSAMYQMYKLSMDAQSQGRSQILEVKSYVKAIVEDFEKGDFSFVEWDPSSDWKISTTAYQGKFSAASADIGNGDTSRLLFKVNVPIDDKVGFYFKTSTEEISDIYGDFLNFKIDGTLMERWAGERDWTFVEYPVTAGEHKLEWIFVKDDSDKDLQDKVWIDNVRLPIGSHKPVGVGCEEPIQNVTQKESMLRVIGAVSAELKLSFFAEKENVGRLYLTDAIGKLTKVLSEQLHLSKGRELKSFSVENLKPGLYLCVFENASGKEVVRFIKY